MRPVVGRCQYCGQEFISKQGWQNHEKKTCPARPTAEETPKERFRKVLQAPDGRVTWERNWRA